MEVVDTVLARTGRVPPTSPAPPGLPSAEQVLGRAGTENFTVVSPFLPARARRHLVAIYGWARLVDQVGDDYAGDRLAALDWLEADLDRALAGAGPGGSGAIHPLVARAAATVAAIGEGDGELRKLLAANRADQAVTRYRSFAELLGYCQLSADPVGRLVLLAFGASTPERVAWSDAICSGLQVVEHCQDVGEDARDGRIYLPLDDLARFGSGEPDVLAAAGGDRDARSRLRAVVAWEAARARSLLLSGTPLVRSLGGRPGLAVAGFVAGGLAAVDAVAATGYDPWTAPPAPVPRRVARHLGALLAGRRQPGAAPAAPQGTPQAARPPEGTDRRPGPGGVG